LGLAVVVGDSVPCSAYFFWAQSENGVHFIRVDVVGAESDEMRAVVSKTVSEFWIDHDLFSGGGEVNSEASGPEFSYKP
jgi:hypothetical protein